MQTHTRELLKYTTTALKTLSFGCDYPDDIVDILHFIPPFDWDSISVTVHRHEEILWHAIDTALADGRFGTLQRFSMFNGCGATMITDQTRLLMPLANARGILSKY